MSAAYGLRVLNDRDKRWRRPPRVLDAIIRTRDERSARLIAEALWGEPRGLRPHHDSGDGEHPWLDPMLVSCHRMYEEDGDHAVISPKHDAPRLAGVMDKLRRDGLILT